MRFALKRQPLRSVDIGSHQDAFLVAAVATIIVIRLQLWATNYPKLGGGKLHFAHLNYGGVFMVVAIGLLVSYLGRRWRTRGAILGGIGFGFFIDEVGKFITSDNDYFFKPTATIIYVVFILLFFIARHIRTRRGFSEREYVMNAIDILSDAETARGLSEHSKRRALALLDKGGSDPLVQPVRAALEVTTAMPEHRPSRPVRWAYAVRDMYYRWTEHRWFRRILATVFIVWSFLVVLTVILFPFVPGIHLGSVQDTFKGGGASHLNFGNIASIVSAVVAVYFMVGGLIRLREGRRVEAYRAFEYALLVTIFVTQVFVFAESSFSAIVDLVISILLLFTVRYMMHQEQHRALDASGAPPDSAEQPAAVAAGAEAPSSP
jgi:hypothetical protein